MSIYGNDSANTITGTSGDDVINGLGGDDTLDGASGNDSINGGNGNDKLTGGPGLDILDGGVGSDSFYVNDPAELVTGEHYIGGSGQDTLVLNTKNVDLSAVIIEPDVERLHIGGAYISPLKMTAEQAASFTKIDAGLIILTDATSLTLKGAITASFQLNDAGQVIDARNVVQDNNTLLGTIFGGNGDDIIYGRENSDTIISGRVYRLNGGGGDDVMTGAGYLQGGDGNDMLTGGAGPDSLTGGNGDDVLDGGAGDDIIAPGPGIDVVIGGSGINELDLTGIVGVTLDLNLAGPQSVSTGYTDTVSDIDIVVGGLSGTNQIVGDERDNIIYGGHFNDHLAGNGGNDLFRPFEGDDFIDGGSGVDTVDYGPSSGALTINLTLTGPQNTRGSGVDTLIGIENVMAGNGDDSLSGTAAANMLTGGGGNDRIAGGAGDDYLIGSVGDDVLNGGIGNDLLMPGTGRDSIDGGAGIDTVTYRDYSASFGSGVTVDLNSTSSGMTDVENIVGSAYGDRLTGDGGNNVIDGGAGNDTLSGGDGDDTLIGGAGYNILMGGNGSDTASYAGATVPVTIDLSHANACRDCVITEWGSRITMSDNASTAIQINRITGYVSVQRRETAYDANAFGARSFRGRCARGNMVTPNVTFAPTGRAF